MGSILSINSNPATWPVHDENRRLKPQYGSDPLVLVEYGTLDDDRDGPLPMTMHMRKDVYDKCVSGEYVPSEGPYQTLLLRNRSGKKVKPLRPGFLY